MSEFDIDTAYRVPTRNQNGRDRATGRPFLIICKFTRRIARDGVLARRKETRRLLPESFDLPEDSELSIKIYTHQTPRLQELLDDAKSFQESHAFKYCWSKDPVTYKHSGVVPSTFSCTFIRS